MINLSTFWFCLNVTTISTLILWLNYEGQNKEESIVKVVNKRYELLTHALNNLNITQVPLFMNDNSW